MATGNRAHTLYIDHDAFKRAQRLCEKLPGDFSVSKLVTQFLQGFVAATEPVVDRALEGDHQAVYEMMRLFAGDTVATLGSEMEAIRKVMTEKDGKEDST